MSEEIILERLLLDDCKRTVLTKQQRRAVREAINVTAVRNQLKARVAGLESHFRILSEVVAELAPEELHNQIESEFNERVEALEGRDDE